MTKSKLHENFFEQEMKPDRLSPREQEEWFRSLPPRMANKTPLARLKRTHEIDSEGLPPLFQRIFYTGSNGVPLHSSHQLVPPAQRGEGLTLLWSLSCPNGVPLHSSHQLVPPAQRGEVLTLLWSPSCPNGVPLHSSRQLVPPAQRGEVLTLLWSPSGLNGVPLHSSLQLVPPAQRGELFDSALESNRSRRSPTSLCRKLNCGGVFLNLQARMVEKPWNNRLLGKLLPV